MSQRDKPQLALNNITAGGREREEANRTREAGHLDEIQGVVANTLNAFRGRAVGFIDWLDFCWEAWQRDHIDALISAALGYNSYDTLRNRYDSTCRCSKSDCARE